MVVEVMREMDPLNLLTLVWVATCSAFVGAIGFGWFAVRPLLRVWFEVRKIQAEMLPLLREVVAHVRTDSGSSLLDIVHRLDKAAKAQVTAATLMANTLARLEGKADVVADDLKESQIRADTAIARGEEAGAASDEAWSSPPDG